VYSLLALIHPLLSNQQTQAGDWIGPVIAGWFAGPFFLLLAEFTLL
jgi:hypothetical protein